MKVLTYNSFHPFLPQSLFFAAFTLPLLTTGLRLLSSVRTYNNRFLTNGGCFRRVALGWWSIHYPDKAYTLLVRFGSNSFHFLQLLTVYEGTILLAPCQNSLRFLFI